MALKPHQDYELVMTGFFFDLSRWQPVFSFVAKTDHSLQELAFIRQQALDKHESRTLKTVGYSPNDSDTTLLLLGRNSQNVFASNHAQTAALLAMIFRHGMSSVYASLAAAESRGKGSMCCSHASTRPSSLDVLRRICRRRSFRWF